MLFDTEDKMDKTDDETDGNSTSDEDVSGQNDESGGDTDILENTLAKKIPRKVGIPRNS